jgi:apolipoprotein N-acyltransferase
MSTAPRRRAPARWACAAVCGGALTLAQPPLGWWPWLFVGWPALALLLWAAPRPRAAAATGWWAGFGFFATGVFWIGEAFLVEAGRVWWYAPLMPLAIGSLAALLAGFWAAGFAAAGWLTGRLTLAPGAALAAALAACMMAVELLRGWALTGFPWALQAYALTDHPAAQAAAWLGAQSLSAVVILAAAACSGLARSGSLLRRLSGPALGLGAFAALWAAGAARLADPPPPSPDAPLLRLVQPNVDQAEKWAPENTRPIFDTLLRLSAGTGSAPPPALVVWPEVAVTFLFDGADVARREARAAMPPGAALAVGAVRRAEGGLRNSLLFYAPDTGARAAVYDKRRLTPFGEYVPYVGVLGRLGLGTLGEGLSGFQPGPDRPPVALPGLPPFAPVICYEIIFPRAIRAEAREGARWLLQVTNDAWFGDSAGPWQHLAQARFRAIETGLPVARAANTGVSAMIDGWGRVTAQLGLDTQGALDSPLPPEAPETLWSRLGDGPPAVGILTLCLCILAMRERRTD